MLEVSSKIHQQSALAFPHGEFLESFISYELVQLICCIGRKMLIKHSSH